MVIHLDAAVGIELQRIMDKQDSQDIIRVEASIKGDIQDIEGDFHIPMDKTQVIREGIPIKVGKIAIIIVKLVGPIQQNSKIKEFQV